MRLHGGLVWMKKDYARRKNSRKPSVGKALKNDLLFPVL